MKNKLMIIFPILILTSLNLNLVLGKIKIIEPLELQKQLNYSIPAKYSNFGHMRYGDSIRGKLFFDPDNLENLYACDTLTSNEDFKIPKISINNQNTTRSKNYKIKENSIIMVERGGCSFVTKARNIQFAGGSVALIINHEQDFDTIFSVKDDGTGEDINILTILIPEKEGAILKDFYTQNKNTPIIIEIDHLNEIINQKANIHLFFSPADLKVYKLLNEIKSLDNKILTNEKINFNPIYSFDLSLDGDDYKNYVEYNKRCICGQKYCEDYEIVEGRTGQDILIESIRQKCLFLYSNNNDKSIYFNYMYEFYTTCAKHGNFTSACHENTLRKITDNNIFSDINFQNLHSKINECFVMSFNLNKGNKSFKSDEELFKICKNNVYLDEQNHHLDKLMLKGLPLISINDNIFYGKWHPDKIVGNICSNLKKEDINKDLKICDYLVKSAEGKYNVSDKREFSLKDYVKYYSLVFLTIIGIIFANIFIFLVCRKYLKKRLTDKLASRDLELKINNTVREYLQLKLNPEEVSIGESKNNTNSNAYNNINKNKIENVVNYNSEISIQELNNLESINNVFDNNKTSNVDNITEI